MPTESPNPNTGGTTNTEVRYVLAGQPTGWTAMAKEVRDFDEEKVRNSKEDIDTLLVFAGLFSAVLSAFLIAAYPSLQADRMDNVVYTLQVIAAQTAGYNLVGNTLRSSMALPPPLPPFAAAPNDIRINVLWFASLVISLITASFAMLVKQWLREFLVVEVPSPQARLRVRHFREPQLIKWKVYEISAMLPLLLQLSLGLFFLGLCYFTAAIHSSIGYTTLPLVVGWALFFFTATALPVFFPRCPYRTTLLKAAVAQLHRGLRHLADWSRDQLDEHLAKGRSSEHIEPLETTELLEPTESAESTELLEPTDPAEPTEPSEPPSPSDRPCRVSYLCHNLLLAILQRTLPSSTSLPDERDIVKTQDQDVAILGSVDAIQANDELLFTAVAEALHYSRPRWTDVVDFVMQILAHRVPTIADSNRVLPEWPFSDAFPLGNLRPQVLEGITQILSEHAAGTHLYFESIFPPGFRISNAERLAENTRFLCIFSIIIAVADVDINFITSSPDLLRFLRNLFSQMEDRGDEPLCQDWIQIAMGTPNSNTNRGLQGPHETALTAHILQLITELVEPANLCLCGGVKFIESLTKTEMDDWGQAVGWSTLPGGQSTHSSPLTPWQEFLHALLHREFQFRVESAEIAAATHGSGSSKTGRVLITIVRSMLQYPESNAYMRHQHQWATLQRLSLIVELASRGEICTEYLMEVLLDHSGLGPDSESDGRSNAMALAQLDESGKAALCSSFSPEIAEQGVENFKKSILALSSRDDCGLLPLLQLCQAAMICFSLVNIVPGGRVVAREIFTSLVTPLRSTVTASAISDWETRSSSSESTARAPDSQHSVQPSIAEVAHACLLTMEYYQHNFGSKYEKDLPEFSEEDSIFPDALVEVLMELDTTELQEPLYSFFRMRRMKGNCDRYLEAIRGLWPDSLEGSAAGERTHIISAEEADNSVDAGSHDSYDKMVPVETDIHDSKNTARAPTNEEPVEDVDNSGASRIDSFANIDTDVASLT